MGVQDPFFISLCERDHRSGVTPSLLGGVILGQVRLMVLGQPSVRLSSRRGNSPTREPSCYDSNLTKRALLPKWRSRGSTVLPLSPAIGDCSLASVGHLDLGSFLSTFSLAPTLAYCSGNGGAFVVPDILSFIPPRKWQSSVLCEVD